MAEDLGWAPLSIDETHRLLASASVPWWIGGGVAIDLFVGRTTRAHDDLDVQILRGSEPAIAWALHGWEWFGANAGRLSPWRPEDPATSIWCRPHRDAPWALELFVADVVDDRSVYRRDRRVSRAVSELGHTTPHGVPFLRPEIQLLYKSKGSRVKDEADFRAVLPLLGPAARTWLADALTTVDATHAWLASLS